jgi:NAD(P)-dependent dehydrogenase (short-subunit alcohol dehydrogenase family)
VSSSLTDRIALVTGAARGIGLGIAQRLVEAGARVVLSDIDADELEHAVAPLLGGGGRAVAIPADVSSAESIAALFERIEADVGGVELLANNAGRIVIKPFLEHTDDDWDAVMATNLTSVYHCCQHAIRGMVERGARGAIVNVSSVGAFNFTTTHVSYAASKAAIVALTRELAYEFGPNDIRVNAISPAGIASRMTMSAAGAGSGLLDDDLTDSIVSSIRIGRRGRPTEVGDLVAFLLSDRASFITGNNVTIAGGADLKVFNG